VGVRSENDYGLAAEGELATKRADYFAAGTRVVWDVIVGARLLKLNRHCLDGPCRLTTCSPTVYAIAPGLEAYARGAGYTSTTWQGGCLITC